MLKENANVHFPKNILLLNSAIIKNVLTNADLVNYSATNINCDTSFYNLETSEPKTVGTLKNNSNLHSKVNEK